MRTFLGWKASFLLEGNSPPHHHKCHRSWLLRLIPVQTSTLVITNIPWPYLITLSVFHTKESDNWFGRDFSFCSAFFLLLWFVVFFLKMNKPNHHREHLQWRCQEIDFIFHIFPAKVYLHTMPSTADLELQRSVFSGPSKFDCYFPYESSTGIQALCSTSCKTGKPAHQNPSSVGHSYKPPVIVKIDNWKTLMDNSFFLINVGNYSRVSFK